jgi:hypothetical protein
LNRLPWRLAACAAAAMLLLSAASIASADTYTVFSCKGPTGVANAALGWAASPPATGEGKAVNACPNSGPLSAFLDAATPSGGASASWSFTAPADTRIVRFAAQRRTAGVAPPSNQSKDVSYVLDTDATNLELCDVSVTSSCTADLTDPIDKQGIDAAFVRFRVLCTNSGLTCSRPLRADFDTMQVGLKDALAPVVSGVNVIDRGDTSGVLTVGFSASDRGGGVYRAVVSVDGKPAVAQALGDANCADANPADADPYQFLLPVPCPAAVSGAVVKVNAKALAAGPHGIEIAVEDAAGNSTSVFGPTQFPRLNAEGAPSTPAALRALLKARLRVAFVKSHTSRYSSIYGQRVVVRGRLRDLHGHGVQGARIDVYHLRRTGKHRRLVKTGLKTRAHGDLTLILPLNVDTRRIEFAYRALRPGPITSRRILHLTVLRHGAVFVRSRK